MHDHLNDQASSPEPVDGCASHPHLGEESAPPKDFWRSLDDKNHTTEYRRWSHNEFQPGAAEATDDERRTFMKLMGASMALAGLAATGCRRLPEQHILPYAARPESRVPGTPVKYASSFEIDGVGRGVLVTSVDSRPTKVDGNPGHPGMLGSSDAITQATILELYDPDRSRKLLQKGAPATMDAFRQWCGGLPAGGKGLAVLSEPSSSPSLADMKARLAKKYPSMKWFEWSAVADDTERTGTEIAFGQPMRPIWTMAGAEVIVALDSDFLMTHPNAVRNARDFAKGRVLERGHDEKPWCSRLYVVESGLTVTGMNADERIAVRSADVAAVAAHVATLLKLDIGGAVDGPLASLAGGANLGEHEKKIAEAMAKDLLEHRGRCLLVAGPAQPAAVHALVALLNDRLGNVGSTVTYVAAGAKGQTCLGDMKALVDGLGKGEISTLVILGGNPAYDAPADLDFAGAVAKATQVVHLSFMRNETSLLPAVTWHIPRSHFLESWGDTRAWDGTIAPQQPLIEPLLARDQGGLSSIELCAELLNEDPRDGYSIVRRAWMAQSKTEGAAFEKLWRQTLNDGVLAKSEWAAGKPSAEVAAIGAALAGLGAAKAGTEITFAADPKVRDGRFSNVTWMQELPDPISKLTWDNAAYLSLGTAEKLGVKTGSMVTLGVGNRSLKAAVWVMPGMADDSVRLHLGYGRGEAAGSIGKDAGFNACALRGSDGMGFAAGASVAAAEGIYAFAHTQDHGAAEALIPSVPADSIQERLPALVRDADLDTYRSTPDFAKHRTHVAHRLSLWEESNLDGARFRWAMSIDLTACIGCSACVTACQAENNIPVVGKEQVMRGREMHWIRIDRYFKGSDPKKPLGVAIQPVACQHCENAPCEQVCPVAATMHDKDGLNVMVYNRCIGTRYCSNNCPYKVRRFNFFDFHRKEPARETGIFVVRPDYYITDGPVNEWASMQFNPDVTVRMRGVMEKCTFCVQRIQRAKISNKNAWAKQGGTAASADWAIADGSFTTACAEACPTQAITFGDLNDPASRVAKLQKDARSYQLLEELNTKARLKYLAKVRNPSVTFDQRSGHGGGHGGEASGHGSEHASLTNGALSASVKGTRA